MKKIVLVLLLTLAILMPAVAGNSMVEKGDISVGVSLGEPFGVTAKYGLGEDLIDGFDLTAEGVLGFGISNGLSVRGNLLWNYTEIAIDTVDLYPYVGAGLGLNFGSGFGMGLAFPIGISYYFEEYPIEVYAEIVPSFDIVPFGASIAGGIGGRYKLDM